MGRRRRNHRRVKNKGVRNVALICFALVLLLSVGYSAFQTVVSVVITGNVKVTDDSCFSYTDNGDGTATLTDYDISCGTTVRIPNAINGLTITRLADASQNTVFNRKNVTKVILPEHLEYIGKWDFQLSSIKVVKFPPSMKVVEHQAFAHSLLEKVELNEGLEKIGQQAFIRTNLTEIRIPSTVKNTKSAIASSCIMVGENAFIYSKDVNGLVDYTTLNSYGNRDSSEVVIPSNVKKIGDLCFYGMNNLKILNIPNTVEEIGSIFLARMYNLETINVGSGIKVINSDAFEGLTTEYKHVIINIDRAEGSIPGEPWGATNATINWTGVE